MPFVDANRRWQKVAIVICFALEEIGPNEVVLLKGPQCAAA